jgi:uncharacterized membrane protein
VRAELTACAHIFFFAADRAVLAGKTCPISNVLNRAKYAFYLHVRTAMQPLNANRFLFLMNAFGIALVILRYIATGVPGYFFLWWNIFLAAIPFGITWLLERNKTWLNHTLVFLPLLGIWFFFLPNAPYIVTDLLHISYSKMSYIWYDILMILTFAISGQVFCFVSLQKMTILLGQKIKGFPKNLFISLSLFASAFGVYLGRYHRFNSWDLLQNPGSLMHDIAIRFADPLAHPRTWGMTILVGIFLHILYFSFRTTPANMPAK